MAHDPSYIERLCARAGHTVTNYRGRNNPFHEPGAAVWFLLGKGLTAQEAHDVLELWWWEGVRSAGEAKPSFYAWLKQQVTKEEATETA